MMSALVISIAMLAAVEPAIAMRCGNKLVNDGDHQTKVLKYCGEPTHVLTRAIYRSGPTRHFSPHDTNDRFDINGGSDSEVLFYRRSVVEILIEEWTYNLGPQKFIRVVIFENGIVTDVRRLGYGYRD
jgi:hypothetical protein